ncbi:alpha-galactosidase 2, partial [Quercus suber]
MPGSLGHEDIDARTFAEWGIDYLKYDNCYHDGSKPLDRFARMSYALQKILTGKYSHRGEENPAKWASRYGNGWRTTTDIKDIWERSNSHSFCFHMKTTFGEDMLDLAGGMASLLIGCDIRSASRETLRILGNKEVIDVNQDPLGVQARKIRSKAGLEVWAGPLSWRRVVIVLWNRSKYRPPISVGWREVGLSPITCLRLMGALIHFQEYTLSVDCTCCSSRLQNVYPNFNLKGRGALHSII